MAAAGAKSAISDCVLFLLLLSLLFVNLSLLFCYIGWLKYLHDCSIFMCSFISMSKLNEYMYTVFQKNGRHQTHGRNSVIS